MKAPLALLTLLVCFAPVGAATPNFVLVIGDDMTWHDCEPYGSKVVRTPNMAKLAKEGMCLDAMFTATAMCAPTRQQLYTGLFPVRSGAYPNHSKVYPSVRSLPHHLKAKGYRVGLIGKRHFGPPASFPFDDVGGKGKNGASNVAAIRDFVNKDKDQPYCLIVCSNEPHAPFTKGDAGKYPADKLTVPPYLVDCKPTRDILSKYYAEITFLDKQLGNCMKIVDESGQRDNTIVAFTSEQGSQLPFGKWTCYDIGLKTAFIVRWPGKINAGSRSSALTQYVDVLPTFLEAAGIDPKTIDPGRPDALGNKSLDGKSFLGVLLGKTKTHRDYVYGAHTTRGIINGSASYPIRSVRDGRYKYIRNPSSEATFYNIICAKKGTLVQQWRALGGDGKKRADAYQHRPSEELYDLDSDPFEMNNLATDPKLAETKARLAKELDRWMKQQGDKGVATEMNALKRQGRNKKWTPFEEKSGR